MPALEIPAPAKINLGLHVLARRSDGYHDIETVFLGIGWADELAIELERPAADPGAGMTCSDPDLPTDERNLCMRAAIGLMKRLDVRDARVRMHLEKRVPYGAGLGGGSSDAAAALVGLARLLEGAGAGPAAGSTGSIDVAGPAGEAKAARTRGFSDSDSTGLLHVAASLGADVPFFLDPRPSLGTGRGDILKPIAGYRFPFHLVVAVPDERVSTAEAYAGVTPSPEKRAPLEELVRSNDLKRWKKELVNDFEASVFERFPEIAALKRRFYESGAGYASMSGSGSAVFGVFEDAETARQSAQELEAWMPVWLEVAQN